MKCLIRVCKFYNLQINFSKKYCQFSRNFSSYFICGTEKINRYQSQHFIRNFSIVPELVSRTDVDKFIKYLVRLHKRGRQNECLDILKAQQKNWLIDKRLSLEEEMEHLKDLKLLNDEMKKLAEEEEVIYKNEIREIDELILATLHENLVGFNSEDVILEITAGVGGQESMLFAKDLYQMYLNYIDYLGFNHELIELGATGLGGISSCSMSISGEKCFDLLRHEGGVHRVQRVPVTERTGRMHTSVVSVVVRPQPSEIQVLINPSELRIDTFRSSGPGGQLVNKVETAVRIVHLPTGISTECQVQRSQEQNKVLALAKLRALIYEKKMSEQISQTDEIRRKQKGLGLRNEKIRTYNFSQDRITDHRLVSDGTVHNIKEFMKNGERLKKFNVMLNDDLRKKLLLEAIKNAY